MTKKTSLIFFILFFTFCFSAHAQSSKNELDEIEQFDKRVAQMKPVSNPIDISVDVIGLEISKGSTAEDQLSKVATSGGGKYYPVDKAQDLAKVFTHVTTGVGSGGGGGGIVTSTYSGTNWLLIIGIFLGLSCIGLLVGILVTNMRRTSAPARSTIPRTYATLQITYSDGGTKSVPITSSQTTIGRSHSSNIVINDSNVSGNHAEISITQKGYLLRDSGSANGTFVNGNRIIEQYLYSGDEITIGSTKLILGK